ncbi:class I SAM-dependent methyltransferase [Variovorax dokdonensis]|uniref:Class I SAM-dependent methyltransferase n=1 Tax=Variovorax dokdonensis TaxID=344883 RepID=A0ABT7NHH3_9BURK|nr:class I SAM-dependent methyltransferase [Variovorax dokdonensis]MDM0047362.1 class I SAM-dependent methyltransferase [Variovorax dokdonensis]
MLLSPSASPAAHTALAPSPWICRWTHLVPDGGTVLDVACGSGRHMRWFAQHGHPTLGVDRSPEAIAAAGAFGQTLQADIESGPWPLDGRRFAGVVVTNYLWRERLPDIVAAVAPGGVLLYETFAQGNETVGKPSRPDFLLAPGELLAACADELRIVAYEDGFLAEPDRFVQRVAAVRPLQPPVSAASGPMPPAPARHLLKP